MARDLYPRHPMGGHRDTIGTQQGDTVRFRISDVVLPPADELLRRLFGDSLLEGRVVHQEPGDEHVAVAVPGLAEPVLVHGPKLVRTEGTQ